MASWLLACILGLLSALHFFWAVGGRWGVEAAIPRASDGRLLFRPGQAACLAVASALMIGALSVTSLFDPALRVLLLRGMAVIFSLRAIGDFRYVGFLKRVRDSQFAYWDTRLYSPLCLVLAALAVKVSAT